jgi:16S rRNA processing protein RimM
MDFLQVGKVANTHGVRGELKVIPLTDNPERFNQLKTVYVEENGKIDEYNIDGVKYYKNSVLLKLKGIDTVEEAEALKECHLLIDRKDAVTLPENSYFICDIVGLNVYDDALGFLGTISEVLCTGSNDVYVVKRKQGDDVLIPALKSVVKEVSIESGTMKVKLLKGLLDDEV